MATSGLDHDIKLWAPTAESPTGLKGLKEVMYHIQFYSTQFFIAEISFTTVARSSIEYHNVLSFILSSF